MPRPARPTVVRRFTAACLALLLAPVVSITAASAGTGPTSTRPAAAQTSTAQSRPNILLVNTDDQRYDSMAVMPKTRRWFSDGVELPRFQVAIPSCCPSRADMLTGRYPHNNGVLRQDDALKLETKTILPYYLKQTGYRTAMTGKFLISWPTETAPPSFDRYATIQGGYEDYYAFIDGHSEHLVRTDAQPRNYSTLWLGDQLRRYLRGFEADDDKPWFAYYAPQAPHNSNGLAKPEPRYANARVDNCLAANETDRSDKPEQVRWRDYNADRYRSECQSQLRALMSVDDVMDEVLTQLEADGELDNTLVIYTSDNGYLWGEHGLDSKFMPYLPAVRVPFLMRWDGHVPAGSDNRLGVNVDIAPTILDAAGVSLGSDKPRMDGESLLRPSGRKTVFTEYFQDDANGPHWTWAATYDGNVHYVEYRRNDGGTVREYYDLKADPAENLNLLGDSSKANDPPATEITSLSSRLSALRSANGPTMVR